MVANQKSGDKIKAEWVKSFCTPFCTRFTLRFNETHCNVLQPIETH